MLDIRLFRNEPEMVKQALASRGESTQVVDEICKLDADYRKIEHEADELRAEIKKLSKEFASQKSQNDSLKAESKKLGEKENTLQAKADKILAERTELLLNLPNLPSPECPLGKDHNDNINLGVGNLLDDKSEHGGIEIQPIQTSELPDFAPHQQIPHLEFAEEMKILDMKRAVKISGPMFGMFRGAGAQLANALIQYGLDCNSDLYEQIRPPSLVKTETLIATGHLPKFSEEAYSLEDGKLWAIPTGEVPLTYLMADEIIEVDELPLRFMAYTPCYRREAGAAGQQTRGMLRVHEFDKVEILACVKPEQAQEMHLEILNRAVRLVKNLGLTYRLIDICTGDIGNSSARTYDVEVYAPGEARWLECSSVSWFSDYQARRANIRYRNPETKKTEFIHTLNGSAVAVPRVWTALVETHRQADGSIQIPEVLHPYMNGLTVIN